MSDDQTRAELDIQRVDWTALAPHAARGGLFLVATAVDLGSVARAVRDDDVARVQAWLEDGTLARPTDAQLVEFGAAADATWFRFTILQPWVLAQRAAPRDAN